MHSRTIRLACETDWPGFRVQARALLAALVPPEQVYWETPPRPTGGSLTPAKKATVRSGGAAPGATHAVVPSAFFSQCEIVILHQDPGRFALLYRLLWRLVHEPELRHDALDTDQAQARHMAQAVRRDIVRLRTTARFRRLEDEDGKPLLLAWFEPDHHIAEAVAPFFVRRFERACWVLFTPECSLLWNGRTLRSGLGVPSAQAPSPNAADAPWLGCYHRVCAPAEQQLQGSS